MKLQPRLIKSTMWMVCSGERGSIIHKLVDVELWESVGLTIHEYNDEIGLGKWRISHVQSGRFILKYMNSREQAIEYLLKIYKKWRDWDHAEEKIRRIMQIKTDVVEMLRMFQKEISGERR